MPRAIRLEVKHVRYVNGKPQVRVRIPDELQKFFPNEKGKPKQALTRFLRNTDVRGMKDEVAVIVGEIKASLPTYATTPWRLSGSPVPIFGGSKRLPISLPSLTPTLRSSGMIPKSATLP